MVLDSSGTLREDVSLDELPGYLADKGALVWCDIYNTEGGQQGPYGRLLAETFGFDELTVEDCFTRRGGGSRPSRWTCTLGRTT